MEAIYNFLTGRYYQINVYKDGKLQKVHKVYTKRRYWVLLSEIKWRKGWVYNDFAKVELFKEQ